jgi:nucleotide-binding universal stress UspA family protein
LVLVQAFEISSKISPAAVRYAGQVPNVLEQIITEEKERSLNYLEQIARPLRQKNIEVTCVVLRGPAGNVIVGYARNESVDLIAIATHGRSGLGRMLFGSVADFVFQQSGLPVLVIKPEQVEQKNSSSSNIAELVQYQNEIQDNKEKHEMPGKILVCLDGSPLAEQIIPFVEAKARCSEAGVILLQVVLLPPNINRPIRGGAAGWFMIEQAQKAEQEAKSYLQEKAQYLEMNGLKVDIAVVQDTTIDQAILKFAVQSHVEMIAISSHGRSGLSRSMFGSIADSVLRQSGLPVLIIKSSQIQDHD